LKDYILVTIGGGIALCGLGMLFPSLFVKGEQLEAIKRAMQSRKVNPGIIVLLGGIAIGILGHFLNI